MRGRPFQKGSVRAVLCGRAGKAQEQETVKRRKKIAEMNMNISERNRRAAFVRNGSMTPEQRFWSKVSKSDGCWEWQGQRNHRGYGELSINNKWHKAHRYSYALHYGEIPVGAIVCHHCDNRACVRPEHLFVGTQKDNMRDAMRKQRAYQPGQHGTHGPDGRWIRRSEAQE